MLKKKMNWESVLDHTFVLKNFFSVCIIKKSLV